MAEDDREAKQCQEDQMVSTIAWFFTGAVIGVAAAMLYTPKSGKENRQFLADKAHEGREAVESASQEIADASREMFERGRKLVEDAADLFERGRKLVKG
jgi:gas vesicle protein